MTLNIIKAGLSQALPVAEHLGNYPMTDADNEEYDSDTDPSVQFLDAASAAERVIDVLIANPELATAVELAMLKR